MTVGRFNLNNFQMILVLEKGFLPYDLLKVNKTSCVSFFLFVSLFTARITNNRKSRSLVIFYYTQNKLLIFNPKGGNII